jgi:tRNA A64-2'-O-ribosylphosphate transferase
MEHVILNLQVLIKNNNFDGHQHQEKFAFSRLNMHILQASIKEGVIIVDATKKGKVFPDSLSKTIPIWCYVFNNLISKLKNLNDDNIFDKQLCLPNFVSKLEKMLIEEKLEKWVEKLLNSGINFEKIVKDVKKPFRCYWISKKKENEIEKINESDIKNLGYYPIYLLSASNPNHEIKNKSWEYIQ